MVKIEKIELKIMENDEIDGKVLQFCFKWWWSRNKIIVNG